jgi:membrane-bound metal-dependent hydrolase YbcI (DUF457 family)
MSLGIGGLIAAYVIVGLVLTLLGLFSKWHWVVKALGIVVISAAYVMMYYSIPPLLGWPTDRAVPRKFALLAIYMQDPDPVTGSRGDIFFWASNLAPGADKRPRAYRVPFTPKLKAVFAEANGKLKNHLPQIGETDEPDKGPFGVPKDWSRIGQKSINFEFHDMPQDLPPAKAVPQ